MAPSRKTSSITTISPCGAVCAEALASIARAASQGTAGKPYATTPRPRVARVPPKPASADEQPAMTRSRKPISMVEVSPGLRRRRTFAQ